MIFKVYNSDFGFKFNGVSYDFDQVNGMVIEDPEFNKLTRGSNAKNTTGLAYKEGLKEPKKLTVTLVGISKALQELLTGIFKDQSRVECYAIDRGDGSSRTLKNAILSQPPRQLTIDESVESMNVVLVFEGYDLSDTYKT